MLIELFSGGLKAENGPVASGALSAPRCGPSSIAPSPPDRQSLRATATQTDTRARTHEQTHTHTHRRRHQSSIPFLLGQSQAEHSEISLTLICII